MTLRQARLLRDYTQEEVAKAFNTSKAQISIWERGHHLPKFETLMELAKFYNVKPIEFITEYYAREIELFNRCTEELYAKSQIKSNHPQADERTGFKDYRFSQKAKGIETHCV